MIQLRTAHRCIHNPHHVLGQRLKVGRSEIVFKAGPRVSFGNIENSTLRKLVRDIRSAYDLWELKVFSGVDNVESNFRRLVKSCSIVVQADRIGSIQRISKIEHQSRIDKLIDAVNLQVHRNRVHVFVRRKGDLKINSAKSLM